MTDNPSLQQHIEELEALNRLSGTLILSSTSDIDSVLQAIIGTSSSLAHAEMASILLFDPSTKETVKTLVHRSDRSQAGIDHTVNMIVAGWVLDNGKPLRSTSFIDAVGLKNPPERYRTYGPILAVPLIVKGEIIGIINLMNPAGGEQFGESAMRILGAIAQQSAQYIHTAKLQETLFAENQRLRQELQRNYKVHGIVGASKKMKDLLDTIPAIAKSSATILLGGETGTGKEIVAHAIHFWSDRADKPFIPINCAAIPANLVESELFGHERGAFTGATGTAIGKFELAHKGTVFLDEISEMPLDLQPKLLRILEERKFYRLGSATERAIDVRIVAATNRNLQELTQAGKFREDLYYRLNVMPIFLPPLRERKEDIPTLAQHFLDEFSNKSKTFSPAALELLTKCEWRGNVRELRNVVERVFLLTPSSEISSNQLTVLGIGVGAAAVSPSLLQAALQGTLSSHDGHNDLLEQLEKQLVELALQESRGNVSEAARMLGVDRKAMERRKEKFRL
ncbi:MAG TPA: sigma 54-interacting transcriptional regulator [Bacteroidota bacterium]|jgi:Nif-specific regulatory protein|nr:sigma 54-interacting transcriptional regulator [Bacteroidota bacterium]